MEKIYYKTANMNILITNDDGIHASGLFMLKKALEPLGKVTVIAPDRQRSASGHSITLHKPLRVERVKLPDGDFGYATNGTPSDCVSLGVLDIVGREVDLVVAGINRGPNLGWDLTYSGTVCAAMEGVVVGAQAFAVSVNNFENDTGFDFAAKFSAFIAEVLVNRRLPESVLLNINVPGLPENEITGVEVTRQGKRHYAGKLEKRTDPMGRTYYWLGGDGPLDRLEEGTDVKAVAEGKVSVTPIHLDLTGYSALDIVKSWGIESFRLSR